MWAFICDGCGLSCSVQEGYAIPAAHVIYPTMEPHGYLCGTWQFQKPVSRKIVRNLPDWF